MPLRLRAAYFDAVGTVLHPSPGAPAVYAGAARRRGLDPDGLLDRLRASYLAEEATDRVDCWVTSEAREVARWRTIVAATLPGGDDDLFAELYGHFARPDAWNCPPGIAGVLAELAGAGLALGLASNYDSRLRSVLAGRPELALLGANVLISSELGVRKPGRGFFDAVIAQAELEPGEILYVGDDYGNDYVGATEAGLQAVLLDPATRRPECRRVASLAELPGIVCPPRGG